MKSTVFHTCNLCEAVCGLAFDVEGDRILGVRPDEDDVYSRGYICPKGAAILEVHDDPDRLRQPMRRTPGGDFEPVTWEQALPDVAERLLDIKRRRGANAVGVYLGNPIVHNHHVLALRNSLLRALGTRNSFSASSQDTAPRFAASYYVYGTSLTVPVPDIERTDYFLCIGANPRASNGSFLTAPDIRGRLRRLRERGGKLVVVDPRRSETACEADEHVAILPGGDAPLLLAMIHALAAAGRIDRQAVERQSVGWSAIESRLAAFAPERVAEYAGVDAATIRRLAQEFADAPSAVAYTRVGVCNSAHGTLATFANDLLNLAAGRVGAVGGWMFQKPPFDATPLLRLTGDGHARWRSRVRGLPETLGDLPSAAMAEEIETPGPGQIRALLTVAGNPVLSTPNGRRLDAALARLEFMASIDLYVNETTRHADYILPPAWGLCEDHVDLILSAVTVRQVVRYSPAVVRKPAGAKSDGQIVLDLIYRLGGGPTGMPAIDWFYRVARRLGHRWSATATADLLLRFGPHGDRFLPWSKGLSIKKLKRLPHGVDLGPLEPGFNGRVVHRDGKMHVDAPVLLEGLDRLAESLAAPRDASELLMIGRRDLRSNNSWMHNAPSLVCGRPRCTLLVHSIDAQRAGVADGDTAVLENHVHRGHVTVELCDDMRPGVVSLPHGWGHAAVAAWQKTAGANAGVSFNDWTDEQRVEAIVGQSILNGVPVRLQARAKVDRATAPAVGQAST